MARQQAFRLRGGVKMLAALFLAATLLPAVGCGSPADGTNTRPPGSSGQTPKDTSGKPPKPDLG